jgi:hypothetical protein
VRIVDDCLRTRTVQVIGLKAGIDGDNQEQEACEKEAAATEIVWPRRGTRMGRLDGRAKW